MEDKGVSDAAVEAEGDPGSTVQNGGCPTSEVQAVVSTPSPSQSCSSTTGNGTRGSDGGSSSDRKRSTATENDSSRTRNSGGVSRLPAADQQIRSSSPLMAPEAEEQSQSSPNRRNETVVSSSSSSTKQNGSGPRRRRQLQSYLLPPRSPQHSSGPDAKEEEDPRIIAAELSQRLENASAELVDNLFQFISACRQGDNGGSGGGGNGSGEIGTLNSRRDGNGIHTRVSGSSSRGDGNRRHRSRDRKKRKNMGLTLPASAIGWLSSRMDPLPGDDGGDYHARMSRGRNRRSRSANAARASLHRSSANSMQLSERVALLRFHLPQYVEHLRITNDEWPPPPPRSSHDDGSNHSVAASAAGREGGQRSKAASGLTRIGSPKKRVTDTPSPDSGRNIFTRYYASVVPPSEDGEGISSTCTHEQVLAARYPHSPQKQAAVRFLFFWHRLQHRPRVDLALFTNVRVLIVDGVLPEWIVNMSLIQDSLEVLRVERACVYDVSSFLLPQDEECCADNPTAPLSDAGEAASERNVLDSDACDGQALQDAGASDKLSLSHVANLDMQRFNATDVGGKPSDTFIDRRSCDLFPFLTHMKLSHCAIGEYSCVDGKEERMTDRSSEERMLNSYSSSMRPFARMPSLESLNLSHNELMRATTACAGLKDLPKLSALDLSFNRLPSMAKAYLMLGNVKTLVLSWNELSSVDGLERMYSLERLALDHNRIGYLQDVAGLASLPELVQLEMRGNPIEGNDSRFRVNLLNLFKDRRFSLLPKGATFRQLQQILPTLDGRSATPAELLSLKEMTFAPFHVSSVRSTDVVANDAEDGAPSTIPTALHEDFPSFRPVTTGSQNANAALSTIGSACRVRRCVPTREAHIRASGEAAVRASAAPRVTAIDRNVAKRKPLKNSTHLQSLFSVEDVISALVTRSVTEDNEEDDDAFVDAESSVESNSEFNDYVSSGCDEHEDEEDSFISAPSHPMGKVSTANHETNNDESSASIDSLIQAELNTSTPKGEKTGEMPDASTPTLHTMPRDVEMPMADTDAADELPITDDADFPDLLPSHASIQSEESQGHSGGAAVVASSNTQEHDFGAAEKAAVYDGSQSYAKLSVPAFLHLYFQIFVFPPTLTKEGSFYETDETDAADGRESNFPRIQLFHSDRELATRAPEDGSNGPWVPISEKFVDVWREEIMACGVASTSRLPPVQRSLRGFHGEVVRDRGLDVTFSESQNVLLCLTDEALYFIPEFSRQREKQERRFPAPLPSTAMFKDAFWPHALARHPLKCLQRITIGFQFQRLVLHFVLPKRSTQTQAFEYAYVAFTCNKLRTISLVQKLQAQKKALHFGDEDLVIDNDDRIILDSLADAIAPTAMGVVLHYQVLRQKWKHQRLDGTEPEVRRVCVLTDSNIYLLDENYVGDGSTTTHIHKGKYGDAALALVDAAELAQVTEIRAASEDPKQITLVVQAKSRLMRSHRWRLVCKDGESAERLIDDVRRSVAAL